MPSRRQNVSEASKMSTALPVTERSLPHCSLHNEEYRGTCVVTHNESMRMGPVFFALSEYAACATPPKIADNQPARSRTSIRRSQLQISYFHLIIMSISMSLHKPESLGISRLLDATLYIIQDTFSANLGSMVKNPWLFEHFHRAPIIDRLHSMCP
jgi:hypothetical protein